MDVLEERPISKLDDDIKKIVKIVKYKKFPLLLRGSAGLASQKYFSDYDFFTLIKDKEKPMFDEFKRIFMDIDKDEEHYFMEFKIQTKNEEKLRWYKLEDFNEKEFKKVFKNISFCKIDIIVRSDNKFMELSVIYQLINKDLTYEEMREQHINAIRDDIKDLEKEGRFYKILKRKFILYSMLKDTYQEYNKYLVELSDIFNSELGMKYQRMSNLQAMLMLLEKTNDKETIKKIIINLKDIHEKPDVSQIEKNIDTLSKEINTKSKSINEKFPMP